ncbi:ATP-dependent 6-phosphofructokinase 4, chloroplastic-like protein [Tanacetum coccineum]
MTDAFKRISMVKFEDECAESNEEEEASEDVLAQQIVVQKGSPRGVHFKLEEVKACIVTCGCLCPGSNTMIKEIVCGLNNMYGVNNILGIEVV